MNQSSTCTTEKAPIYEPSKTAASPRSIDDATPNEWDRASAEHFRHRTSLAVDTPKGNPELARALESIKKMGEKDPTGRDQHQPGAKVDAGKNEYDMVLYSFPQALAQVDRIGKFGARKYTKGGFLDVPDGQRRYFNAEMRHAAKHQGGELLDPDSGELHLAHKAWNALAELELYLREQEHKAPQVG